VGRGEREKWGWPFIRQAHTYQACIVLYKVLQHVAKADVTMWWKDKSVIFYLIHAIKERAKDLCVNGGEKLLGALSPSPVVFL